MRFDGWMIKINSFFIVVVGHYEEVMDAFSLMLMNLKLKIFH
jgi:hypothetical protein